MRVWKRSVQRYERSAGSCFVVRQFDKFPADRVVKEAESGFVRAENDSRNLLMSIVFERLAAIGVIAAVVVREPVRVEQESDGLVGPFANWAISSCVAEGVWQESTTSTCRKAIPFSPPNGRLQSSPTVSRSIAERSPSSFCPWQRHGHPRRACRSGNRSKSPFSPL